MAILDAQGPKKRRFTFSLRKIMLFLALLLVPILLAGPAFLLFSVLNARETAQERITMAVEAQLDDLNGSLSYVNLYLADLLMNDPLSLKISSEDVHERNVAARDLYTELARQSSFWNDDFCFFYYSSSHDLSVTWYDRCLNYNDCVEIGERIKEMMRTGTVDNRPQWSPIEVNGRVYFFQVNSLNDRAIASWIACDSVFSLLQNSLLSENGFYSVIGGEGRPLLSANDPEQWLTDTGEPVSRWDCFTGVFETARVDMRLLVVDPSYLDMGFPMVLLLFFVVILLIVLTFSLYTFFYFHRYIERPFQQFQNHIKDYAAEQKNARQRGFSELNEAVEAFDSLKQQLEELKIDVYEEKLALARTELEYFQLQIKPHFFVNCFSILFGMAQKKDYGRIQEFCLKLSDYVRYLFRDGLSTVLLSEELAMVREYLEIQGIRHRTEATMEDRVDASLLSTRIPPLLLLSFVENSVKYGTVEGQRLCVYLSVSRGESAGAPAMVLTLRDNGPGFSPENLLEINALAQSPDLSFSSDGRHIGLRNICRRLSLLYGSRYSLTFSNWEGHAQVVAVLPRQEQ